MPHNHSEMDHPHQEDQSSQKQSEVVNHQHHQMTHQTDHSHMNHSHMDMDYGETMNHSSHMDMDHGEIMDHSSHMGNLKTKFIVSLFLAIPILLLSPMMGVTLPFQFEFPGSEWVVLVLSTILFFYGGMPFLKGAKMELAMKAPAMMTLISMGISVSYLYSLYAFFMNNILKNQGHVMDFFWELATLIVIMLLGHWLEMVTVSNASNALEKMAALLPTIATKVDENGNTKEVDLKEIKIGDKVLVKAGEKIPTDGRIITGETTVNESLITGEAQAVKKVIGEQIIGGSLNGSGTITVEVTGTGETSYLSQVMELVKKAQKDKSSVESLSDKVARGLFYVAVVGGAIAFISWWSITSNFNLALERMVTVLVIACPHALGLAIPLVKARSTSLGAQHGLLVKNRQALEVAKNINVVTMDKTGTLTAGDFSVTGVETFDSRYTKEAVLSFAAALEANSNHPLSQGVLKKVKAEALVIPQATNITTLPGVGLAGEVNGQQMKLVSLAYVMKEQLNPQQVLVEPFIQQGASISFLLVENQNVGLIAQGDRIKDEAKELIKQLKVAGIQPVMLTGDNQQAASMVANILGITTVHAELLPNEKEQIIKNYQNQGEKVMMVGDGINDAPSLARSDIGVAIGAGTDVAIDSADVILVKSNPADVLDFLSLAKNTQKKMVENLWWGAGYNIIAIPLAAGALASFGILLSPALGAVLMSLSTIIVAINAMLLKIH